MSFKNTICPTVNLSKYRRKMPFGMVKVTKLKSVIAPLATNKLRVIHYVMAAKVKLFKACVKISLENEAIIDVISIL